MTTHSQHPYHPIIYVCGFAATPAQIETAVSDPYMGFNVGSTRMRLSWTGEVKRFYFESPLVRLMTDHGYRDVFVDGQDLLTTGDTGHPIAYRSIITYRYYDEASVDFGEGETPPIEHFARGLDQLILRLREKICANAKNAVKPADFRVHLVAHSMGGLICRAFLQNRKLGSAQARAAVDKLFTYATPHNGIDLRVVRNVPGWLTFGDIDNFNRKRMADYLDLSQAEDVSVVKHFPPQRIFNLVGTDSRDYNRLWGAAAWIVGEASDGLVHIDNATTHGPGPQGEDVTSPRAFVYRSHSGPYGIINSEVGYQNLTRFLFGQLRVDGILQVDDISLPVEVQKAFDNGKRVHASYQFEATVSLRGCQWQFTRRVARENSAIFRRYDQLFPGSEHTRRSLDRSMSPHLFSVFLDRQRSVKRSGSVSFAFDLKVLVPDYEVDGALFLERHYEGGFIYRELILVEIFFPREEGGQWRIKYGNQETNPGKPGVEAEPRPLAGDDTGVGFVFDIPIEQKIRPGLRGSLRLEARPWS